MGKESGKKKKQIVTKRSVSNLKQKAGENSPRAFDMDMVVFISMAQEHKDEGNKLFQKRDYEGAMLKYDKALKLLPRNHIDVSYLHSNMAACYMQMGITEYPRAIHECNLALEVTPRYSKALLKRARCYEALNRLDLALRDINNVLKMEPNNIMASEIEERLRVTMEKKGPGISEEEINSIPVPEYVDFDPSSASSRMKTAMHMLRKKKSNNFEMTIRGEDEEKKDEGNLEEKEEEDVEVHKDEEQILDKEKIEEKKAEEKLVPEDVQITPPALSHMKSMIEKVRRKKIKGKNEVKKDEENLDEKKNEKEVKERSDQEQINEKKVEEKKAEDKLVPEEVEIAPPASSRMKSTIEKVRRKKSNKVEKKLKGKTEEKKDEENLVEKKNEKEVKEMRDQEQINEEKKAEDKLVVEEKISTVSVEEEPKRIVKLVFGEDIRFAKVPYNCTILKLREIIHDRFPRSKAFLTKYRDHEGDLVTITTNEELRWAEASAEQHGSLKLFIVEVSPEQDPFFDMVVRRRDGGIHDSNGIDFAIDDWIIQFAQLFKNCVGFNSDAYLDLHELGMKAYSEAMEDTVSSEEAQDLFNAAGDKFQEMAALALFNCGNVHMSKARKRVYFPEDASRESILEQVKVSYDWAQKEYTKAGDRYEEALKIKPDFYESVLALGQQQYEQAKLSWYYAVGTDVDLETWDSAEVLQLYNYAEDNMEKGMQMWEEAEKQRIHEASKPSKAELMLQKVWKGLIKDVSSDEAADQAANMRSQINLLWGTMLYERSIMEYKLGLPVWHECLEAAVEKFELAGASQTDIAVMVKNHCSNDTALEGLGFNIDEIIQAWNEMYEAKRWQSGVPSFRLEPLLRRRVSKLFYALEHT